MRHCPTRTAVLLLAAVLLLSVPLAAGAAPGSIGGGVILPPPPSCHGATPGDADGNGSIDIADVTYLIDYVCHDGPAPANPANGDVNADCSTDLDDVYYLIDYLFEGGPAPMDCVCGDPPRGPCTASCDAVTPGDANGDGTIDIADVTFLIALLCQGGPPPSPLGNGDVDADCDIDMDDVNALVAYLFEGGPAPMDCVCGAPTIGDCSNGCEGVVPGDTNGDGGIDVADVTYLVAFLCDDGPAPDPLGNGDVNADCVVNGDDIDALVAYIFEGGPAPQPCVCGTPAVGECDQDKAGRTRLPDTVALWQNSPNPFNPRTAVSFRLPAPATVRLEVLDLAGRRVAVLADGAYSAGQHTVVWNGTDAEGSPVAAGVYFYRLRTGDATLTRRMILVK